MCRQNGLPTALKDVRNERWRYAWSSSLLDTYEVSNLGAVELLYHRSLFVPQQKISLRSYCTDVRAYYLFGATIPLLPFANVHAAPPHHGYYLGHLSIFLISRIYKCLLSTNSQSLSDWDESGGRRRENKTFRPALALTKAITP